MAQVATVAISLAAAACQEKPRQGPALLGYVAAPPASHKENAGETESTVPRPTTGSICLPPVQQEENANEMSENSAPPLRGRIRIPPKKEDENTESPDQ